MSDPKPESFGVIGAGAVGTALASLLLKNGHPLRGISTRTDESLAESLNFLDLDGEKGFLNPGPWCNEVELLFITVPDDRISPVATTLSDMNTSLEDVLCVHCSGAHTAREKLGQLEDESRNVRVGSFHPLQTVPDPAAGVTGIPEAWIGIEGSPDAVRKLERIATRIGARPFEVPEDKKTIYHAAAVFACNHVIGLLSVAEQLMDDVTDEVENPLAPLLPLIEQSVSNAVETSPLEALTGPAVRGDLDTVQAHVDELNGIDGPHSDLYIELTKLCFRIAAKRGDLPVDKVASLVSRLG